MERVTQVGQLGVVNKYRDEQIASMQTWQTIPDDDVHMAALHIFHIVPLGSTTITQVNPVDPADGNWRIPPSKILPPYPAGKFV